MTVKKRNRLRAQLKSCNRAATMGRKIPVARRPGWRKGQRTSLMTVKRRETAVPDTNWRNGLASIDTMKCGRNWNASGRGRRSQGKRIRPRYAEKWKGFVGQSNDITAASGTTIMASNIVYEEWSKTMWMRSCALCKALLRKLRLSDSTRCKCGWEWLGHP